MIEAFQAIPNGFIQLLQRQKLTVPQRGQNVCGDDSNGTFHGCLILGSPYPGRNDGRSVMLSQFLIGTVQNNLVTPVLLHAGFQVVALNHPGHPAEIVESIDVCCDPRVLVHAQKRFHIAVGAEWQCRDEDESRDDFTGV